MDLCIALRHAESQYNVLGRVNGDPCVPVPLSANGRRQALSVGPQLRGQHAGLVVHSRFERTRETARLALGLESPAPFACEPMLDDIACGVFEGGAVELDHAWRNARSRNARPPGGESLVDATQRVAAALRRILARPEPVIVVVAHELALRYLLNGARGRSGPSRPVITVPNATVYLFSPAEMALAVACIESALASAWADQAPGADGNGG